MSRLVPRGRLARRSVAVPGWVVVIGAVLLLAPVSASARAPTTVTAPWKGVAKATSLSTLAEGCATSKALTPTWSAKSGRIAEGVSARAAICSNYVPGNSPFSEATATGGVFLFVPVSVSPSTDWVNISFSLFQSGAVSLTHTPCPAPPLDAAGNGTAYCLAESVIFLDVYTFLLDSANRSFVSSLGDYFSVSLGSLYEEYLACVYFNCTTAFYNYTYSGWTNGASTGLAQIGGGCAWYGSDDFCQDNSSVNAPIGFVTGHHYLVGISVADEAASDFYTDVSGSTFQGSGTAAISGGAGDGTWLSSISVS